MLPSTFCKEKNLAKIWNFKIWGIYEIHESITMNQSKVSHHNLNLNSKCKFAMYLNTILTLIQKQNLKINDRTSWLVLAIISLIQLRLKSWCSDGFPCLQCILSLCCHTSCRLVRRLLYAAAEVKFRPEPAMMADSQFWVFEFISWCCKGTCFLPKKRPS